MLNTEQLKMFINSMPGWVLLLDHEAECFLFNQAFADNLFSFPSSGKLGATSRDTSVPFWFQHLQTTFENGRPVDINQIIREVLHLGVAQQHRVQLELQEGPQWATLQVTLLPASNSTDTVYCVQFQFEASNVADLSRQNHQLEQELGLLKRLQVLLAHNDSLEGVFSTVVNATFEIMDHALVYVVFEEAGQLRLGPSRGGKPDPAVLSLPNTAVRRALSTHEILHLENTMNAPAGLHLPADLVSLLAVPFGRSRQTHGVLMVESRDLPLNRRNLQALQMVVSHLNVALDTVALHHRVNDDLRRLTALYGVSQAIHQHRSRQGLLEDIAQRVQEALLVRWSLIFTLTKDGQGVANAAGAARSAPNLSLALDFQELQAGLSGWVMRERKPALSLKNVPDDRESPLVQERRRQQQIGSVIVAPLLDPETPRVLGTLTVLNGLQDPDFTDADVQLVMSVAHQVAVSLSQRELLDRLLHLGR
ncbi:GAF domain-containing protein [Deinococcus roseus]|nr:GAF domain-containing protein [Deinococcus roseus]